VDALRSGIALRYTDAAAKLSFLGTQEAAAFLDWAGAQSFTGPVNAASHGALSAHDLFGRVADVLDARARTQQVAGAAPGVLSPFDAGQATVLDTARASSLGFKFSQTDEWLDNVIRQHDLAFV
jgi:hypothetical protein